jgi:hypothetical protein
MADQLLYPEPEWHVLECLVEERRCHVVRSRREQRVLKTHSSPEPVGPSIGRRAEDRDHLRLLEPPRSGRHRRNRSIASGKPPVWPGNWPIALERHRRYGHRRSSDQLREVILVEAV